MPPRPDFTDQAHPDPSLGRMRPRSVPRQTIGRAWDLVIFDEWPDPLSAVPAEPVNPEPPRWMKRIDAALAIALLFVVALLFGSRLIANAVCGV